MYVLSPIRRRGLSGAGHPEYADVLAAQKNDARTAYGETVLGEPGAAARHYPRVTPRLASLILEYWMKEAGAVDTSYTSSLPDSAVLDQWTRAVVLLRNSTKNYFFGDGDYQDVILFDDACKEFWDMVSQVALGLKGVKETPTTWALVWDAVPSWNDLVNLVPNPLPAIQSALSKLFLYSAGALILYGIFTRTERSSR